MPFHRKNATAGRPTRELPISLLLPNAPVTGNGEVWSNFEMPPLRENAPGQLRKVGVRIEFGVISARQVATALAEGLGSSVIEEDAHAFVVEGTGLADLMAK